ncbi:MAG: GNAT family N-acetyltransferase [Erysipelotrichaceae bacterium]|jgi:ribosomal protein S18 acetylase RimI-like enzyme|nr:GNAT family N-acetyltransferase [Bacilli bacterium]NLV28635.1 GNAT family N-acetyltransferase [Erysipelotrichaceae bacterium]
MKEMTYSALIEAKETDIPDILKAMERLHNEFPSNFFVPSTAEELKHLLIGKHGFINLLKIEDQLAGGVIVIFPDEQNHYLSNHEFSQCAIIDSIFLDPQFRGQGIAQYLIKTALERLNEVPYIYASVAIQNIPSQKLFQRHGFKIYEQKKLYNNYERYVFLLTKER